MEFDFGANQTVDAIDLVPENFRGAYVEKDGGFHIADTHKPFVELITGLGKSLKASRAEAKQAKSSQVDLTPLAAYGSDPASIAEKVTSTIADLNDKLAKGVKIDPEKIKAELQQAFQGQITAKDGEITSMMSTLSEHLITAEAIRAITTAKGVPDLLMPHINSQVKVVKDGAKYRVAVVDKDGDARISGVTGANMTIADLVQELKTNPVFGRAFESETPSGGGTQPTLKQPTQGQRTARTAGVDLSPLQMIEAGLNQGLARGR